MNTLQTAPDLAAQLAPVVAQLAQLGETIKLAASIPGDRRLVSKSWLMEYFGGKSTALEKIIATPGFPAAIKIPGGPLRWKIAEVMDWTESQHGKRAKRPDLRVA